MKWIFLIFVLTSTSIILGQEKIEGILLDRQTNQVIPFAKIYNLSAKLGTITNDEGYFKIDVSSANDVILITQIGYKKQNLLFDLKKDFQTVYLDANLQLIQEMIASPRDNSYLYELVQKCRLNTNKIKNEGKAYYGLNTFIDTNQIEFIEGFYNYSSIGYDMGKIDLKAGRLAIQPFDEKMFMSLESSKAIVQLKLFENNTYFPENPFDMKVREMKKHFYLNLKSKYLLDNKDSVYIVNYIPKDTSGNYFFGSVWINKSKNQVLKVTTNCADCGKYPFLPIFPVDEIKRLDMNITKTFIETNGKMCFNHVDFQYDMKYRSVIRDTNFLYTSQLNNKYNDSLCQILDIKTKAVLYSYDQEKTFLLPKFNFDQNVSDYRKINALPHNSFFWKNNTEDRVNSQKSKNELFFEDSSSIKDKELFNTRFYGSAKYSSSINWYKEWSKNRIRFKNMSEIQDERAGDIFKIKSETPVTQSEKYELEIQLFADINIYNDSIHILTAAIFDPFKSYYYLPMDMGTHCFINMYFDLHEIARRELQIALENDPENFEEIYTKFINNFKKTKRKFFSVVERGTKEKEMNNWNSYILQKLGIDNLALFNPFPTELENSVNKPKGANTFKE
jgi:hypothetical protein|tara:strand:- start:9382 stop:11235 length:1854 start_codon:yes stop_codon:yes gene_type:complete